VATLAGARLLRADGSGKRSATHCTGEVSASPEAVFPLLCPVREREWLEGWTAEIIYSKSGVAEENCVFRTPHGPAIWNINRYEPPKAIDFTVVSPEQVSRLVITLERTAAGGTKMVWSRTFTGLKGQATHWDTDRDRELMRKIEGFLAERGPQPVPPLR
jgi:hypothetical protein